MCPARRGYAGWTCTSRATRRCGPGPAATGTDVIAGGTDVMVSPQAASGCWDRSAHELRHLDDPVAASGWPQPTPTQRCRARRREPGLWEAARTVGSPQIRNAARSAGIGIARGPVTPAGARRARRHRVAPLGRRHAQPPFGDSIGPKRSPPDELILAPSGTMPGRRRSSRRSGRGTPWSSRRRARPRRRSQTAAAASASARAVRRSSVRPGQALAAGLFDEQAGASVRPESAECDDWTAPPRRPIDDVKSGTAAYRRHVLAVMGARALARVARLS